MKQQENKSLQELGKRYCIFLIGLFINSFGVSFITKASLGTSPISSIPYTLSLGFHGTLGTYTLYMSLVLIFLQIMLLRKNFPKEYFLQIPVSLAFSWFIDCTMKFLSFMVLDTYPMKFLSLIVGCFILGFGVYLEVVADVVMLPGESFVKAVAVTFKQDFGKTKIIFDSTMAITASVMGFILFHKLAGVREGTIIAALLVGYIARVLKRKLGVIETFILKDVNLEEKPAMNEDAGHIVITISREYGSGGRKIAQRLAKELGYDYYDKNIIEMAAKESNLSEEFVEEKEQTMTNSLLYDLFSQYKAVTEEETTLDKLYEIEAEIIKDAAKKSNCVIVGRCSDYILKDVENCYNIYIYAKEEFKIREIMQREHLERAVAIKKVYEINKKRFIHYKYYTGREWDISRNFQLCLDVSNITVEGTVELIKQYINSTRHNESQLA